MMVSIVCLFGINILVFDLYSFLGQHYQERAELRLISQQNQAYQQQLAILRQSQETMQTLRHDFQHHLMALQAYCQQNQSKQALEYAEALHDSLQPAGQYSQTGNQGLDAIINYHLTQGQQAKIVITSHVQAPTTFQRIKDRDICAILGNLLDNSIRAVQVLDEADRWLDLAVNYQYGNLTIRLTNPYKGEIKKKQGRLLTTKPDSDNHGIGLRSVEKMAEGYQGQLLIEDHDQQFQVLLTLGDMILEEK